MLPCEWGESAITMVAVGSGVEKNDRIKSSSGSRAEFCPAAFGLHEFPDNGKAKPGPAKFAALVGRSPKAVEGPFTLFLAEARPFVDDVESDD